MKVVSVVNYKGGVGKTTLLANIAIELAIQGKKVLILDLDPQGSLTFSFIKPDKWKNSYKKDKTIKNWFDNILNNKNNNIDELVINDLYVNKFVKEPIGIIASHLGLFDVSLELSGKLKGRAQRTVSKNKLETVYLLKKGLEKIKDDYDIILIDCQPSFDLITQNAIVASDYYFIPTKFDYLSTIGVTSLEGHIDKLVKELNKIIDKYNFNGYKVDPKPLGIVGNMVTISKGNDITNFNQGVLDDLKKGNIKVFDSRLRNNSEFMDMKDLIPAIVKKPLNPTNKNVIIEIKKITEEFIKGVGL